MAKQNITLSIPKDVLLKVKLLAVRQQTSVSGLLTQSLIHLVEERDAYEQARRRHLQFLDGAPDLGTDGSVTAAREELHERS
jgi:hypothetical protein